MKNKIWNIIFALMIAVIGYMMVSSANRHIALDNEALYRWSMNWADRR